MKKNDCDCQCHQGHSDGSFSCKQCYPVNHMPEHLREE